MKFKQTLIFLFIIGFQLKVLSQNAPIVKLDTITATASSADVAITVINFNNIKSFDLKITYDPSVTIPTDIVKGLDLNGSLTHDLSTQGIIKFIWNAPIAAVSTLANGAELLKISFEKVGNGSSILKFDESDDLYDCQFYSSDGALYDIPAEEYYSSGLLTFKEIQSPVTRAPDVFATIGSDIDVPITISNFNNIGAVSLTLNYDSNVLNFNSGVNTGNFPDLSIESGIPGIIKVAGNTSKTEGYSLQDSAVFFTLNFTYRGGTTELAWLDDGESCEYNSTVADKYEVLNDSPQSSYYINGSVSLLETKPTISIDTITDPTRCGENGTIALNFTNVPDGYHTITYSSGSFLNVAVSANTAKISALAGTYNDLQINVNGQSSPSGINAKLNRPESPEIEILNNTGTNEITCNTSIIEVTATGGENYLWHDGTNEVGNEASLNINSAGIYTVTVYNSNECISKESIEISEDKSKPVIDLVNISGLTELTDNDTIINIKATGGINYLWTVENELAGSDAEVLIKSAGTYMVTVTGANGCIGTEVITITEDTTKTKQNITTGINDSKWNSELFIRCYPNPFNGKIKVNYSLPCYGSVALEVINIYGKQIDLLANEEQSAGDYTIDLNGTNWVPGIYLIRLRFYGQEGTESLNTIRVIKK